MRAQVVPAVAILELLAGACAPHPPSHTHVMVYSDRVDREGFGLHIRRVLRAERFDQLDAIADSLQRVDSRFDDGASRLFAYYFFGMRAVDNPQDPAEWQQQLDQLRAWQDARPQSREAPVAIAAALIGRGWAARGGGYAPTVSANGWRGFAGDLQEARSILDQCADQSKRSPLWYEAELDVMHGLGVDPAEFDTIYFEAVRAFPTFDRFHADRSENLMPRWYGAPGDWERAAAEAAPGLPDSLRDEIYARIVVYQSTRVMDVFKESPGLDWDRTVRGLEVWQRRFPASPEPLNALAMFAYQTGRREVARQTFKRLGNRIEKDTWGYPQLYLVAQREVFAK